MGMRAFCVLLCGAWTAAAATFGTPVAIIGAPTDVVLDEARQRVYVANSSQNRIEVYAAAQRRLVDPIPTCAYPLAAAKSRNGAYLYVACYSASALDVIDLETGLSQQRITLPAAPEGVAVGGDERVLITTLGSGAQNADNRILLFDPFAETDALRQVASTLPAPGTPTTPSTGQAYNSSRSHLATSADGRFIVGLNNPTATTRQVFVFEVASGSILRSRTVTNISAVLSVAPDGSKFMAGLSLFDTETLAIEAQQNAANSMFPFANNVNFNTQQNQGGSVFAADGSVLYTAFNIAPATSTTTGTNTTRANVTQLMLNDPDNLLIRMAIQMPENLTGKMVIDSRGANAYALSQSGLMVLPVGSIYDNPVAEIDNPAVLLANDQCSVSNTPARVTIRNAGRGRMTATASVMTTGLTTTFPLGGVNGAVGAIGGGGPAGGAGGGFPGIGIPIILPGGGGQVILPGGAGPGTGVDDGNVARTPVQQTGVAGTAPRLTVRQNGNGAELEFAYNTTAATSMGTMTPTDFTVQSPEAINVPWRIRTYQNNRNAESVGNIVTRPVGVSTSEGLADIVSDPARQRLYIANSGLNRVEVFDTRTNEFLAPIKVGQLPRSLALAPDGRTLYVANNGGESISIIDLEAGRVTGKVKFPPTPYNATFAVVTPTVIASTLSGLQIIMSNGALWKSVDDEASPRSTSPVIGTTTLTAPRTMIATPGGEYAVALAGNGIAYLYDAMSDEYVLGQQVSSAPIQGYFGAMAAGPGGRYYVINGALVGQSLTPIQTGGGLGGLPTSARPIAAVSAVNANSFVRFTQPTRTSANAAVTDFPTVEMVDTATGLPRASAVALEGPLSVQVGTQRVNMSARTMATDASGSTAYLLTTSGLSIVSMTGAPIQNRPLVNPNGVVNGANYQSSVAPGSVASIFGQNLASDAMASSDPLPTVMGGVCVTLDNRPIPIVMTSASQINVQVPPETTAARHSLVVRNVERKAATLTQQITVAKYAPAVYVNPATGMAAVFRPDGSAVSASAKAHRDEALVLYATGLGVTKGQRLAAGKAAPADPPAETETVQVYFGDYRYSQAEMIVESSALMPGVVGVYEIHIRVPGDRMRGDALPVTLKIGGVMSPTTGSAAPTIAVE